MDQSAIKEILAQSVMAQTAFQTNAADLPVQVVHNDYKLQDIEKYLEAPQRFRGRYETSSIESFGEYITAQPGLENAACFINPDKMRAVAVIDFGNHDAPQHKDHTALITAKATPEFDAVMCAHQCTFKQRELAEWMEDWRNNLQCYTDAGEKLDVAKAIQAVRKWDIEAKRKQTSSVGNLSESRSTLESVEAKSEIATPGVIEFLCAPYEEFTTRTFAMRLGCNTDGGFTFKLRVINLEKHTQEIANEFREKLQMLETGIERIFIGTFS